MKKILFFLVICIFLLSSCISEIFQETYIEMNAVWSEDYENILSIRTTYQTKNIENPHYGDFSAKDYKNILILYDSNLENSEELFSWNDEYNDGAWIQSSKVYYRESKNSIYYSRGNTAFVRSLDGSYFILKLPEDEVKKHFTIEIGSEEVILYEDDLTVPVLEILPSPNGEYISVLFGVALLIPPVETVNYYTLGIFDGSGNFLKSISYDYWNGTDNYLKVSPLLTEDEYNTVPTHDSYSVFWKSDSQGFYILNSINVENIEIGYDIIINSSENFETKELKVFPDVKKPTSGGYLSDKNELIVFEKIDENNYKIKKIQK